MLGRVVLSLGWCALIALKALAAVQLDPEFDSGPGTELFAEQVIPLQDDKLLVCGVFRSYNEQPAPYLMRLNQDGTIDPTFQMGTVNNWIRHMAVQPDGKIIVAGAFSEAGGLSRNLIARLNADGTLDPTFDPGTGFEEKLVPPDPNPPYVFWLALQADGKIVVVGSFAKFNGQPASGIARLNPDGSRDTTFQMGSGLDSWGRFVMVQPNEQIIVSGWFTSYNGFGCNRLIRLNPDGTPDDTFRPYFGDKTAIYSAAPLPDGKMIVSGHSKSDFNLFKRGLTRLNSDGSEDPTFVAHTNERTESILLQPDGKIIVCGWFTMANDVPRWRLARFNPDGSLDENFRADTEFFVWNMAFDSKGRLIVVGGFPLILGERRSGIARLIGVMPQPEPNPEPQSERNETPEISSSRLLDGLFALLVQTSTNRTYHLEARPEFISGEWKVVGSIEGDGTELPLIDPEPLGRSRCYRLCIE